MPDIAAEAGVPLADAHRLFRSKFALLAAFRRDIDEAVLRGNAPSANDPVHERLFEILMRRFEALRAHRPALRAILRDSIGTSAPIKALPGLLRSMTWMLAAAGVPTAGWRRQVASKLLAAVYFSVFPAFFKDESPDLGTTMSLLDRRLRQAETLFASLGPVLSGLRKSRA